MKKAIKVGDKVLMHDGRTAVVVMPKAQASGLYMLEIEGIDNWTKFIWLSQNGMTKVKNGES